MIRPLFESQREVLNLAGGFIALSLVGILMFLCWSLVDHSIPEANENIVYALVGGVMTQVTQIVGFFFGSSQQAKKQSDTIDHLSRATSQPGPTINAQPGDTVRTESATKTETRID